MKHILLKGQDYSHPKFQCHYIEKRLWQWARLQGAKEIGCINAIPHPGLDLPWRGKAVKDIIRSMDKLGTDNRLY